MGDFGKLNFSVSFNRTSAFPIEANGYFESLESAQAAAQTAVEVGSAESTYYIGETLTVVENGIAKTYIIQPDKTLKENGSGGSGSDEVYISDSPPEDNSYKIFIDTSENISAEVYTKEECNNLFKSKISTENVSENTKELQPNRYYIFGEMAELTITLAEGEEGKLNEYMFEFTSGTAPTTLTLPESVKWMGEHTIEASKTYQVSIVNNIAVIGGAS